MFVICPKCGVKYKIPAEITLKSGQKMQCSACEHYFVFTPPSEVIEKTPETIQNESVVSKTSVTEQPVLDKPMQTISVVPPVLPEAFQPLPIAPKKTSLFLPILIVVLSFLILLVLLGLAWQYRLELRDQNMLKNLQVYRPLTAQESLPSVSQQADTISNVPEISLFAENNSVVSGTEIFSETSDTLNEKTDNDPLSFRSVRFQLIQDSDRTGVQIEGLVHNDSDQIFTLPPSVMAVAYDFQGNSLFTKEIYLSKQSLYPDEELPFFGTYSPAPKEIKWIDISYQK